MEARLPRVDEWLFRTTHLPTIVQRTPRGLLELFELAYLFAYPFVPGALGLLYATGFARETDRFCTAVLTAGFVCYGALPWLQTRPPRALEPTNPLGDRPLTLRRLNLRVLSHGSIQVNTLPRGHAATALAAALVTGELLPGTFPLLLAAALAIAVATVLGRYHYSVDTLLGLAVGVGGWFVSRVVP